MAQEKERKQITFVMTRGVKEYRATIPHYVNKDDVVLEVGVAWGTTTAILARHAKKVVGIDPGDSLPTAIETYPHIQFEPIDGFDIRGILALGYKFTKIYIDISGCRRILDVMSMVIKHAAAFEPEVIVVKSTRLKGFISNCIVWSQEETNDEQDLEEDE